MISRTSYISLMFVLLSMISCATTEKRYDAVLFCNTASDTIPYRIPALAVLSDGSLLALADYRHCGSDIGYGRVDIHGRIADEDGWGEPFALIEGTGVPQAVDCGFGDAAVAVDDETGEVLVVAVCGQTVYGHPSTTRTNPNRIAMMRSGDNCITWEAWKEITEDIYSLYDRSVHGPIQSCFVTSGKIFQSRVIRTGSHYRIYCALCARPNGNRVIFSDDFGRTWKALGGKDALPVPEGDEAKCEELPDGSLVISSRTYGGRYFNVFTYSDVEAGDGLWDEPEFSGHENGGCTAVDNACNGELVLVPASRISDKEKVTLAFQSVPLGPQRKSVGIYYKEIGAHETASSMASGWSGPYRVTDRYSAYSTMVRLPDGNMAVYYEEGDQAWPKGYDMVLKELSLETLTGGFYKARRR